MTDQNKRSGISKIALTNFQVFAERTEIPIEKITLMFGPNSAGKSAIEDAFEIIQMLRQSTELYGKEAKGQRITSLSGMSSIASRMAKENPEFITLLESSWRKKGNPPKYSQDMAIEISYSFDENEEDGLHIYGFGEKGTRCKNISELFGFQINDDDFSNGFDFDRDCIDQIKFLYQLKINDEFFLGFNEDIDLFALSCDHSTIKLPDFLFYFKDIDICELSDEFKKNNPELINWKVAYFNDSALCFQPIYGFSFNNRGSIASDHVSLEENVSQFLKNKVEFKEALSIFSKYYEETLSHINDRHSTVPSSLCIGASRKIPSKDDLFIYSKSYLDCNFLIESQLTGFTRHLPWVSESSKHLINVFSKNNYASWLDSENVFNRVNYFLTNQLFIELGYYLGKDSEYIPYKDKTNEIKLTFTQFYLTDSAGTRFNFDEVGSGLGYVLPVLCALAQDVNQLVMLQQPELHLHPALQAALGDVIIESADSKTLLIETHSEHLLLRILKRIRQTHLQAAIAPELKINADDVCVLYFDPSPDGSTTVKRLRISEDGEFMDRWPRGFFGERDQELSDE